MKVLIDPVYTSKVHQCSTSYLVWEIIEHLIAYRDDIFFYLLVPEDMSEEEFNFVDRHKDRVKTFPYPYIRTDRAAELFKLDENLLYYLAPGESPIWDYDVVLTSRIPMIPYMRNVGNRRVQFDHGTHRYYLGIEEMPLFSFRDTVPWNTEMNPVSLSSYSSAGAVVLNNLWTKKLVSKIAREWLAPSKVRTLLENMHEAVPVKLERLDIPDTPKPLDKTLNVVFAGRMTNTRNFKDIAELFRKHYSYPIGTSQDLRFIVSTQSQTFGATDIRDIDFVEIQKNNRDQFHALLKNEAHVVVNLSSVEDFSLSTYEPLLYGVPVIVADRPWTSFLGPDYPFRVRGFKESYAMVKMMAEDYERQMERFREWESAYWKPFIESPSNVSTGEKIQSLLQQHEDKLHNHMIVTDAGDSYKELIRELQASGEKTADILQYARSKDKMMTDHKKWRGIPISLRPNQHLLKLYANVLGLTDTLEVGVMVVNTK